MGQGPLGECVGREALVHQPQSRDTTCIGQVFEVGSNLVGQQKAFVNNRAARHARHVIFFAVLQVEMLDRGAGSFADYI